MTTAPATKALEGVRVLDMTHVQSGPSATQLLGWLGADVVKLEAPTGDITRGQLRDLPDVDSLYFTMLNCNKRSITLNTQNPARQGDPHRAHPPLRCDGRELRPGRGRPHGLHLGADPGDKPPDRVRLDQGLRGRPVHQLQGVRGRRAGHGRIDGHHRLRGRAAARDRRADRRLRNRHPTRWPASWPRSTSASPPGAASASRSPCSTRSSTCAASSCAINKGWRTGPLAEYPNDDFGTEVPRSGNASGGGQPGWAVKCAPGGPNDYVYVIVQPVGWQPVTELIGRPELATDPEWRHPRRACPSWARCSS